VVSSCHPSHPTRLPQAQFWSTSSAKMRLHRSFLSFSPTPSTPTRTGLPRSLACQISSDCRNRQHIRGLTRWPSFPDISAPTSHHSSTSTPSIFLYQSRSRLYKSSAWATRRSWCSTKSTPTPTPSPSTNGSDQQNMGKSAHIQPSWRRVAPDATYAALNTLMLHNLYPDRVNDYPKTHLITLAQGQDTPLTPHSLS
jgi:hypothetical protein